MNETMPYRILHVIWNGNLALGLIDIVEGQKKDPDLKVAVAVGSDEDGIHTARMKEMGVTVFPLGMRNKYGLFDQIKGAMRLGRIIRQNQYDVLHYHEALLPFVFMASKAFAPNTRVLLHNHGEFVPFFDNALRRFLSNVKRFFYRPLVNSYADVVVVVSRFIRQDMLRSGIPERKVKVLLNAAKIEPLLLIADRKEELKARYRKELGVTEKTVLLGTAARLVGCKRLEILIEVFSKLRVPDALLVIMGEGDRLSDLKELSARMGVREKVRFLGYRTDAKEVMAVLDAVVLPTRGEAFGLTAFEAVVMKVPVFVLKDGGGLLEFIHEGETGFICDDTKDLLHKMNAYINKQIGLKPGTEFYKALTSQLETGSYLERLKAIYLELLMAAPPVVPAGGALRRV